MEYRNFDGKGKEKPINKKQSEIPIFKKKQQVSLGEILFPFDLMFLHLSLMYNLGATYPKNGTSFVFTKHMIDELGNRFIRKIFGNKNTDDLSTNSGIFKKKIFFSQKKSLYST